MKVSIVSCLFRSEATVSEFCWRAADVARKITKDYEIILVNDYSPDRSLQLALEAQKMDSKIVVIDLARNYGHQGALLRGMEEARGDLIFVIDDDLDEEPEWLADFYEVMQREGCDVVFGVRKNSKDSLVFKHGRNLYYAIANSFSSIKLTPHIVAARLMTRDFLDAVLMFPERNVFINSLWAMAGFSQVPVTVEKTCQSPTSYLKRQVFRYFVFGIFGQSTAPLVFILVFGFLLSIAAVLASFWILLTQIMSGTLSSWSWMLVSFWLLGSVTIFFLGIIGVYLGAIFHEVKQRPRTITRAVHRATQDSCVGP